MDKRSLMNFSSPGAQQAGLGDEVTRALAEMFGTSWFVNTDKAGGSGDGLSWASAKKTIQEAVDAATAGDAINIVGSAISEAVTCAKAGIRFYGGGATTNRSLWTAVADGVCLTLSAADCLVTGFRFRPPAYSAGTPAAISLATAA